MTAPVDWIAVAIGYAKDAHEAHFSSRRGVWTIADRPGVVVLYDSAPGEWRDVAMDRAAGDAVLAIADWPPEGEQRGYTRVVIARGEPNAVTAAWERALAPAS